MISAQQGLDLPGVTVNRYCSSSLQTIRMAAHAIMAGEGDCFVAGGVETVSRYMHGAADTGPHNEIFADAETRTKERSAGGTDGGSRPPACPTSTSRWARPPRTSCSTPASAVSARTSGAFRRRTVPRPPSPAGSSSAKSPVHPSRRHRGVAGRRHPPRHHSREGLDPRPGVPSRRHRHRRQRLPAQ